MSLNCILDCILTVYSAWIAMACAVRSTASVRCLCVGLFLQFCLHLSHSMPWCSASAWRNHPVPKDSLGWCEHGSLVQRNLRDKESCSDVSACEHRQTGPVLYSSWGYALKRRNRRSTDQKISGIVQGGQWGRLARSAVSARIRIWRRGQVAWWVSIEATSLPTCHANCRMQALCSARKCHASFWSVWQSDCRNEAWNYHWRERHERGARQRWKCSFIPFSRGPAHFVGWIPLRFEAYG